MFTADEAWEALPGRPLSSVHLAEFPGSETSDNAELLADWERIFAIREEVLKALEEARVAKDIGSSLEAKVVLTVDAGTARFLLDHFSQLRYIFIVSQVEVVEAETGKLDVKIAKADGTKCERCWNYSTRVGGSDRYPTVCERCLEALTELEASAASE